MDSYEQLSSYSCQSKCKSSYSGTIIGLLVFIAVILIIFIVLTIVFGYIPAARVEQKLDAAAIKVENVAKDVEVFVEDSSVAICTAAYELSTYLGNVTKTPLCQNLCKKQKYPWCS